MRQVLQSHLFHVRTCLCLCLRFLPQCMAQADQLSKVYFEQFDQYASTPAVFVSGDVKELAKKDLKVGDGAEATKDSKYAVYYLGWNPAGKTFDSSISGSALKSPLVRDSEGVWTFPGGKQGGVIEGWEKGVLGMKVGGVRELTIPANLAYKDQGQGEDIPANTPLKFIIMILPAPVKLSAPQAPAELHQSYNPNKATWCQPKYV